MVYGTYNYSYWGESKPTYNVWGPHIVGVDCGCLRCHGLGLHQRTQRRGGSRWFFSFWTHRHGNLGILSGRGSLKSNQHSYYHTFYKESLLRYYT